MFDHDYVSGVPWQMTGLGIRNRERKATKKASTQTWGTQAILEAAWSALPCRQHWMDFGFRVHGVYSDLVGLLLCLFIGSLGLSCVTPCSMPAVVLDMGWRPCLSTSWCR